MTRPTAGFTLVELMVALLVTGLVVTTATAGVSVVSDAVVRSQESRQPVMSSFTARRQVVRWLRSATLLGEESSFRGIHRRDGTGLLDEVSFDVADGGSLYPGPHRIRLWVERDARSSKRGVVLAVIPLRTTGLVETDTLVVAPGATGLGLRYLAASGDREDWALEWLDDRQLPRAVEVRLQTVIGTRLQPGGGSRQVSRVAPLWTLPLVVPIEMEGW